MGAGIIINISIVLFNLVIIKFMIFRKYQHRFICTSAPYSIPGM
jgi:hypothetical protein